MTSLVKALRDELVYKDVKLSLLLRNDVSGLQYTLFVHDIRKELII